MNLFQYEIMTRRLQCEGEKARGIDNQKKKRIKLKSFAFGIFMPAAMATACPAVEKGRALVIWDNQPAPKWDVAYPVGNGRLGAMPFGAFPQEKILINEETIWQRDDAGFVMGEDSFKHLEKVRELEAEGKYEESDQYFVHNLQNHSNPNSYQLFGWLHLDYDTNAEIESIHRELDLATGIAMNRYILDDGTVITQKVFASAPDDLIAVGITASREINLMISIPGGRVEQNELIKEGSASGENATRYVGHLRARSDGEKRSQENSIKIMACKEANLYLTIATDFNYENAQQKRTDDWRGEAAAGLAAVAQKSDLGIEQDAVADHSKYFDRVSVDF